MKEYIATFETGVQITPNDFTVMHPTLKVNEHTTVKEIHEFYKMNGNDTTRLDVKLIEVQQLPEGFNA